VSRAVALICVPVLLALAGCGGADSQDADEPSGDFAVQVVKAEFPSDQKLAKRSELVISVKNSGNKTIPNIAATVKSFDYKKDSPNLSDPSRPIFVVNRGPAGGETAYVDTSALGPLRPGETKDFVWNVTAVRAGEYKIDWSISAGLDGKAKAVENGKTPTGSFSGNVSSKAPDARVADDGKTVVVDGEER
jgi:hypothetical protein